MRLSLAPALDRYALATAVRAAIVLPTVFALSLRVFDAPEMAPFAFFSGLSLLVFVDFGGSRRERMLAYALLTVVGAAFVTLGTLCSTHVWLATLAMAVIGFAILFSGVLSGYLAAASTPAILSFVLPAMLPAPDGALPDRLAGWLLGCGAALLALSLPWPRPRPDALRGKVAAAIGALAQQVGASADGDPAELESRRAASSKAVQGMRRAYLGTPLRPTGATGPTAAIGQLVEDVVWIASFRLPPARGAPGAHFPREDEAVRTAVAQVLRGSAAVLARGDERPDLGHLLDVRRAAADTLMSRLDAWRDGHGEPLAAELEETFRLRVLSFTAWQLGSDALLAAGETPGGRPHGAGARLREARELLAAHTTMRSVWLRNSLRGALGLTLAVLVGQLADAQHAYWIVLGTLVVLRSQALSTGVTFVRELAGTTAGIVAGGLLLLAVGTDTAVLWAVLPPAALVATYARRAISFVAGQACFSFLVLVVINLIEPAGWEVGLVRVEDVAIGATISLLAAALLWPRGAASVLRADLAAAYARAAELLAATVHGLLDARPAADAASAAREAVAATERLRATLREYLSERSRHLTFDDLGALVAGATRLRRTAEGLSAGHQLLRLEPVADASHGLRRDRARLSSEVDALCDWYAGLGRAVRDEVPPPPAPERDGDGTPPLLRGLDDAPRDDGELPARLAVAWTHEHLELLEGLEPRLAAAAGELAGEEH